MPPSIANLITTEHFNKDILYTLKNYHRTVGFSIIVIKTVD